MSTEAVSERVLTVIRLSAQPILDMLTSFPYKQIRIPIQFCTQEKPVMAEVTLYKH